MGKRERERLRTNKLRAEAGNRERIVEVAPEHLWGGASWRPASPSPHLVDTMVMDAAHASWERRDAPSMVAELADRNAGPVWCALVTARVVMALTEQLTAASAPGGSHETFRPSCAVR